MPKGQSVIKFLETFQGTVDEAAVAGLTVLDSQLVIILLGALPQSWRSFISVQNTTTLTFPILLGKILQENAMRTASNKPSTSEGQSAGALFASGKYKHQAKDKKCNFNALPSQYKDLTCHYCNKRGHIQPECPLELQTEPTVFTKVSSLLLHSLQLLHLLPTILNFLLLCLLTNLCLPFSTHGI